MNSDFEKFAQAIDAQHGPVRAPVEATSYQRVCILGGGIEGRVLASLTLAENMDVTLFSAYGAELEALRSAGSITLRGEGPIGTFQIDQPSVPSINVTAELDNAVTSSDLIFLTGPVHKQKTYAMVLADYLHDGQTLVITPSRSFAGVEANWLLRTGGCTADICIIELSHLPYWVHPQNKHLHLSKCPPVHAASLPGELTDRARGLTQLIPDLKCRNSTLATTFIDASGVIESVAMMFGGSLIAQPGQILPIGAVPLEERKTFFSLIDGIQSQNLIKSALQERREVARHYGIRDLPDYDQWSAMASGSPVGSGARGIPSLEEAKGMLRCAVSGSLVPLQSAARQATVNTPVTDSLIHLAGASLGFNLAAGGRRLDNIGLAGDDPGQARKRIEAATGGKI